MKLIIAISLTVLLWIAICFIVLNRGYPVPKGATDVKDHCKESGFAGQDYVIHIKGRCTWDAFQDYVKEHDYIGVEDYEKRHDVCHSRGGLFTPSAEIPWWDYRWDDSADPPPKAYIKKTDDPGAESSAITFEKGFFYIVVVKY